MELYDLDIEKMVVGSLISNQQAYDESKDTLTEDCFHCTQYQHLYRCIVELVEDGGQADVMTLHARMLAHGWDMTIGDIAEVGANRSFTLSEHVALLHDLSVRRRLVALADKMKASAVDRFEDPNDIIEIYAKETEGMYRNDTTGIYTLTDTLQDLDENMQRNMQGGGGMTGTPTGFRKFDEVSSGMHGGDLIVIAAESSQGKTSLAMNIVTSAAMQGGIVAVYSLEMSRIQLSARMVSSASDVTSNAILYHRLSEVQYTEAYEAAAKLSNARIFFDDRATSSISNILASIRYLHRKEHITGALVDYIQLLTLNKDRGRNDEMALAEAVRQLKNLAKELDIWIIAISQLSRDKASPAPNNNRLRGSGQILEAADTVMLLYRPEVYNIERYPEPFENVKVEGTALVTVSKGRNIGLMQFIVGFDAKRTRFYDIDDTDSQYRREGVISEEVKKQIEEEEKLPF